MKRIMLIAAIIAALSSALYADGDFGSLGMTAGYTAKENSALMGINGEYQLLASVSESTSFGFSSHVDIAFGLGRNRLSPLFIGTITGIGSEMRFSDMLALNLTFGAAVVAEMGGSGASVGIGPGLDAAFSFFLGMQHAVGITLGATAYPQFLIADDAQDRLFSVAALGYVAMSFRYPAPVSALAIPIAYMIY